MIISQTCSRSRTNKRHLSLHSLDTKELNVLGKIKFCSYATKSWILQRGFKQGVKAIYSPEAEAVSTECGMPDEVIPPCVHAERG